MKFCLDNANLDIIRQMKEFYPLSYFSMNPSVARRDLKDNGKTFAASVADICAEIGDEATFFVQTVGDTAAEIVKDAQAIRSFMTIPNLLVKVCASAEGYKAMRILKSQGFTLTATAVGSVSQAMMSIEAGADTVAVYINRIDMAHGDGIKVLADSIAAYKASGNTGVSFGAASIKTPRQVELAALAGADVCAVDYDVIKACGEASVSKASIQSFLTDWEDLYGKGKRVYNL